MEPKESKSSDQGSSDPDESQSIPQVPSPEEGDPPRAERDPRDPTATAPDSVEESVYEEAEHAGQEGQDAADPPTAARKAEASGGDSGTEPGADLDPDEAADAFETDDEAQEAKSGKEEERRDEDIISLDSPD